MSTTAAKRKLIEDLMEKAGGALARTAYFEAERLALKALLMARQAADFDLLGRIILPLQEARRQRVQQAIDAGRAVCIHEGPITEDMEIAPGCWLVQPPQVGADARKLRLAALQREIPVAVLCREPATRLGQVPIVAIGTGETVRTRIDPPKNLERPTLAWFLAALEALGDQAIADIDPMMEVTRRLDAALARLDIVPEHEKLHQFIEAVCREACQVETDAEAEPAAAPKRRRVKTSGDL